MNALSFAVLVFFGTMIYIVLTLTADVLNQITQAI